MSMRKCKTRRGKKKKLNVNSCHFALIEWNMIKEDGKCLSSRAGQDSVKTLWITYEHTELRFLLTQLCTV